MEYVRRQIAAHPDDGCRVFFSERGECTPRRMGEWGAEEIDVNHLKALVQPLGSPLRRPQLRVTWLYRRCDRIVALTPTDREDILRFYGRDLKVDVEPNTLDGWNPQLADGLPNGMSGPFRYVCIGRFDYQKGQDRWIREISKKEAGKSKKRGGRTLFVGDGPTLAGCKQLAQELGVADSCVFAGAIPDADRYLKCAEVVVSPSRWEGMPYLMMKARALGCRILATDCPGNRDVLAGYENWALLEF